MTPKLTLTTPLGIFGTAVFVRHWNDSTALADSIRKEFVRTALTSNNTSQYEQGLATLYHIINDRLHSPHGPVLALNEERLCIIAELRCIAMFLEKGPLVGFSGGADQNLLIEDALDEIIAYFKSRFACTELAHIRMPDYYRADQLVVDEPATYEFCVTQTGHGDGHGDISLALRAAEDLARRTPRTTVIGPPNQAESSAIKN